MDANAHLEQCVRRTVDLLPLIPLGTYPYVGVGRRVERGSTRGGRTPPWTAGFWIGQLHLATLVDDSTVLRDRLRNERSLATDVLLSRAREFDHDIGFLGLLGLAPTARDGVTSMEREALLCACHALAGRFNGAGRFIRAHGWEGSRGQTIPTPGENDGPRGRFIADTWMNLPLLYWGAEEFGEPHFADVANAHADTSLRLLIRDDAWSMHGYEVDPDSGAPIGPSTIQGATPSSPWARAQAWTIYGMMLCGRLTGRQHWVERAQKMCASFVDQSPGGAAPWDFSRPDGDATTIDTSASAIVCSAAAAGASDTRTADRLAHDLSAWTTAERAGNGLLGGGCYFHAERIGMDEPSAWGDYFWMESCVRRAGFRVPYDLTPTRTPRP